MANIVNESFFVGELYLPNLTHTAELAMLTSFINKYEQECLLEILGYPLYKAFGSQTSQRMTDLLSGVEYYDGENRLRKWRGLKHDTTISLIANYVYFYYQRTRASHVTGTGVAVQKQEAGDAISPAQKMVDAWNFFSEEVAEMCHFLWMKKDVDGNRVYPEFSYYQYVETRRITRKMDSVFQF